MKSLFLIIKRSIIISLCFSLNSGTVHAKVSDFNELLDENESTQAQLHDTLRVNLKSIRSLPKKRERIVMSDDFQNTVVAPSKPLKYKKEIIKTKRPSPTKSVERIGAEMKQINQF